MKVQNATYVSSKYTVIIPTFIVIITWLFFGIVIPLLFATPSWVNYILYFFGFIPGFLIAIAIYKYIYKFGSTRPVLTEISLNENLLEWHLGKKTKKIDLNKSYFTKIKFFNNHACIEFYKPFEQLFYIKDVKLQDLYNLFPEKKFIIDFLVIPYEGSYGFLLNGNQEEHYIFFKNFLECLWRTRNQNEYYLLYKKFPWERKPQPKFFYIHQINLQNISPEDAILVDNLKKQILDNLENSNIHVTPDYLLGQSYNLYYIMPIGYINLKEESILSVKDRTSSLYIIGKDKHDNQIKLEFNWFNPIDPQYEEASLMIQYVQKNSLI